MSASDISRVSTVYNNESIESRAKRATIKEIQRLIGLGQINSSDVNRIRNEYTRLYYYYHAYFLGNSQRAPSVVYKQVLVLKENPRKFPGVHACIRFDRTNLFLHAHRASSCLTVGRYNYPLDEEETLETKEAILPEWPGPLDRCHELLKVKVSEYINTLGFREQQRRIRYISTSCDAQRKIILEILEKLLSGNGVIDAKSIAKLLLRKDQYELSQYDKDNEKMQKYLLIGQRKEASKYAKSIKLWNHSTVLCLLDEFQPPSTCDRDNIVQHLEDLINSVDDGVLSTVYHALFNRIQHHKPKSTFFKNPSVGTDDYKFALLCANDCEMEFDQVREDFKLIVKAKQASSGEKQPESHLISLGHRHIDSDKETRDEDLPSYISHLSFEQDETHTSRTSIISNIDMLILNEIWEHCLNLARGTCDSDNYIYIINLIPYKLVFLSMLFDYGLYEMFARYLNSIKRALYKARQNNYIGADPFYDWSTIEIAVENISQLSKFCQDIRSIPQDAISPMNMTHDQSSPPPPHMPNTANTFQGQPMSQFYHTEPTQADYPDSYQANDYPSMQYQGDSANIYNQQPAQLPPPPPQPVRSLNSIPPPTFYQSSIPEEAPITDFNPAPIPSEHQDAYDSLPQHHQHQNQGYDYSNEPSRRTSMDVPAYSSSSMPQTNNNSVPPERTGQQNKVMTSSSPLNQHRESTQSNAPYMADSFNAFSPINEYDDLPRQHIPEPTNNMNTLPPVPKPVNQHATTSGPSKTITNNYDGSQNNQVNNANKIGNPSEQQKSHPGGDPQKGGLLANLYDSAKAFLPKSNSKQMILPDDSNPTIEYDEERNKWVDKNNPDGDDNTGFIEPPPMMGGGGGPAGPGGYQPPINYSAPKKTRARYPNP